MEISKKIGILSAQKSVNQASHCSSYILPCVSFFPVCICTRGGSVSHGSKFLDKSWASAECTFFFASVSIFTYLSGSRGKISSKIVLPTFWTLNNRPFRSIINISNLIQIVNMTLISFLCIFLKAGFLKNVAAAKALFTTFFKTYFKTSLFI